MNNKKFKKALIELADWQNTITIENKAKFSYYELQNSNINKVYKKYKDNETINNNNNKTVEYFIIDKHKYILNFKEEFDKIINRIIGIDNIININDNSDYCQIWYKKNK